MGAATRTGPAIPAGLAVLAFSTAGMLAGVEPFATWYYPFAWYSTLLTIEAATARRDGRFFLLGNPRFALSLFGWSIPFWLFFELLNFQLGNWYYVLVTDGALARWTGIVISFATVLPAIFLAERALRVWGPWREKGDEDPGQPAAGPGFGRDALLLLQALGLIALLLPLAWPGLFFPLVWLAVTLIADPWVYRRDPSRSLLRDVETGRHRRPLRLLSGGMAIGLLWELFNVAARGKWIYTVPGLEELKLFEMPLLGFFGFPFLALEGWSAYQALVVAGLAADPRDAGREGRMGARRHDWALAAVSLAALFSALVLRGMESATISSTTPRIEAHPDPAARLLGTRGYDVFRLADARPRDVASAAGVDPGRAEEWIAWARLTTLRGIGSANVERLREVGVATVRDLARQDPAVLAERLAATGTPLPEARVRVWVRAAARASS